MSSYEGGYLVKSLQEQMSYQYNEEGMLSVAVDANQNCTNYIYIGTTLVRIDLSSGQSIFFEYANDKVSRITDDTGRNVRYEYEGDYLTKVTCVDGGVIRYEYTEKGYIRSITDQNGRKYVNNTYDDTGRVIRQVLSNGQEYTILYNDADRVNTFFTASNGERKAYAYNKDRLITKVIYTDNSYEETAYDSFRNKIYEKTRNGAETSRKFSEMGQLIEEILPGGLKTCYTYDTEDHLIRISDNAGKRRLVYL